LSPSTKRDQIEKLVREHGRLAFNSAYRILADQQLAEDVMQDVFVKLFDIEDKVFTTIEKWPAYLRKMSATRSIDIIRKTKSQREDALEANQDSAENTNSDDPQAVIQTQQSIQKLHAAIERLPEQEANVFLLRFLEQFSYSDIAAQLSISVSHVGVLLNRAKQNIGSHYSALQSKGVKI
jgi:RNA polymerase sigma-70 factor (ECF subfamily)